jgi:hypothetical protein
MGTTKYDPLVTLMAKTDPHLQNIPRNDKHAESKNPIYDVITALDDNNPNNYANPSATLHPQTRSTPTLGCTVTRNRYNASFHVSNVQL